MGFQADHIFNLCCHTVRICTWKIDLVNDREYIQVMIQRQIYICQSLGLDSLGSIYYQHSTIAGCQASGYLIVKIHMSRCVDQVKNIFVSVFCFVYSTYSLGFNGNAALTFQVHIVENLFLHLTAGKKSGFFNDPVCQCGFTVVYMGNNTKITYFTLVNCCHSLSSFSIFFFLFFE